MRPTDPTGCCSRCAAAGRRSTSACADDTYVVASEPYGLVEETADLPAARRRDAGRPERPGASQGQIVVLDAGAAGELDRRRAGSSYDGTELPVDGGRAAARRDHDPRHRPRRLPRTTSSRRSREAPASFRKTLRGKIVERDGRLDVRPRPRVAARRRCAPALRDGSIRRVVVIGQGTAAVAGQSLAAALRGDAAGDRSSSRPCPPPSSPASARAPTCTTRSSSRSARAARRPTRTAPSTSSRARGASVVAIVNRRQQRSRRQVRRRALHVRRPRRRDERRVDEGVLRADRGRLPARARASPTRGRRDRRRRAQRTSCSPRSRELPDAMRDGHRQPATRSPASRSGTRRPGARGRSSATASNRIAAHELRIKLSELCYKSIACDVTEDKKHIDLSSEPLILVCAAGLTRLERRRRRARSSRSTARTRPRPIVDRDRRRDRLLRRDRDDHGARRCIPTLGFVLVDDGRPPVRVRGRARRSTRRRVPLREARAAIEAAIAGVDADARCSTALAAGSKPPAPRFFDGLRTGIYDGHLEAEHRGAARVAAPLRAPASCRSTRTSSSSARSARRARWSRTSPPRSPQGIEELTRPIDAIKHQAKTVTVGISRSDETLLRGAARAGGARGRRRPRQPHLPRAAHARRPRSRGRARSRASPATASRATSRATTPRSTSSTAAASPRDIPSRTDTDPRLRGTKHRVGARARGHGRARAPRRPHARHRARGEGQPGRRGSRCCTSRFADRLARRRRPRRSSQGYRDRYAALKDPVTETEPDVRRRACSPTSTVVDLLTEPVSVLADHWRTRLIRAHRRRPPAR